MRKKEAKEYKGGYFDHWLAMYDLNQEDFTRQSIEQQIEMYKGIEGDEEYNALKQEVRLILKNKDLGVFLKKVKKGIKLTGLELMTKTILDH